MDNRLAIADAYRLAAASGDRKAARRAWRLLVHHCRGDANEAARVLNH